MYTFDDRSGRSLTLRPEGTAPIARAYVEHGLHRDPQPVKAYTVAPMYRYGCPGRGRYREHWQVSVEAIGTADPAIDAEVIEVYTEILRQLGVTQWELRLNSIGDAVCRPAYVERLNAWLDEHVDAARRGGAAQTRDEPVAGLRRERSSARGPRSTTHRRSANRSATTAAAHFAEVRARLDRLGVPYVLDPTLVRGLDYYTRTTFEFIGPEENVELRDLRRRTLRRARRGRSAGRRRRASASGPGSSGCCSRSRTRTSVLAPSLLDVFVVVDGRRTCGGALASPGAPRSRRPRRRHGLRRPVGEGTADPGARTGATTLVVVGTDDAVIRRHGAPDETVGLAEVVATLTT